VIEQWRWREIRGLWLLGIGFELVLVWLVLSVLPNSYFPIEAGRNVLDPDALIASLDEHRRFVGVVAPFLNFIAILAIPLTLITLTAAWLRHNSPPLRAPPGIFAKHVAVWCMWLVFLAALSVVTFVARIPGGPLRRCLQVMPFIMAAAFYWLRSMTHPRRKLREDL
jgi:hypothetical protein